MEEDIKNMSKEELLEYLEDISQQLDNIALDQIKIAIAELQYFKDQYKQLEEENESLQKTYDDCYCKYKHYKQFESISVQKVKDKIEELKNGTYDAKIILQQLLKD